MSNKSTIQKQSSELVQNIVDCALEKKAEKLLVLDVYNLKERATHMPASKELIFDFIIKNNL